MLKNWIVFRILGALLMLVLLVLGAFAIYNAGWSHGYLAASASSTAAPAAPNVYPYTGIHPSPFFHPMFGPGLLLIMPVLMLALFLLLGLRLVFAPFMHFGMFHRHYAHMMREGGYPMHPAWKKWHEQNNPPTGQKEPPAKDSE